MRVAVLCEFSGIVRDAFLAQGHDAISCDLEPTEKPGPHIQDDCRNYDWSGYDIIIAHPPCKYLSWAARSVWNNPGRKEKREKAVEFFMWLWKLPSKRKCIENVRGHIWTSFRRPDQIIHPYFFGDPVQKSICLWINNLPRLIYSEGDLFFKKTTCEPKYVISKKTGKKRYFSDLVGGWNKTEQMKNRSRFFPGIARAMAQQWGSL